MNEVKVNGLTLENIKVTEVSGYSGYDVYFTFKGKNFNFMIAKMEPLMPLSILHRFKEQGICPLCNRFILPFPIGYQPCLEFKKMDKLLLEKFKKFLPANYKHAK